MDTDQGEERAPERPSEEKFEVAVDYDEEDEKEEYIPLQGPFEFDSKEESLAAFDEMIRAAFGRMEYNDIKRKVWKSVEKLCMHDGRWAAKPTIMLEDKKNAFESLREIKKQEFEKAERLREKAEINIKSLIYAASGSDQKRAIDKIKMLVRLGTDPNCRLPRTKKQQDMKPSKNGKTAMYGAAKHGRTESITLLHTLGADVNLPKDNGCTPIYVAAEHNQPEVITLLHSLGADVDKPKKDGFTPMLIATQNHNLACIKALHAAGADINKANHVGQTPLSHAVQKRDKPIEDFLRGLGAVLGTEDMMLKTVDDVIEFFEVLGVLPEHIPNFKKNLRSAVVYGKEIDASTLFAISDGDEMRCLLDEEMHDTWGFAFVDIIQHHMEWQAMRMTENGDSNPPSLDASEEEAAIVNSRDDGG